MSISVALSMPASSPATGNARSAATPDGDAFASLLEAERAPTEAPVVPGALTTPQAMSAPSPASQLQTLASADPAAANSTAAETPTNGSAQPTTSATLIEDAATVLLAPDATVSASMTVVTPQASAAAATAAAGLQPADTVTDTDAEAPETGGPVIGELAAIPVAPGATAASGAIVVTPAGISQGAQLAAPGASAVPQPSDTAPDIAPEPDAAADAAEAVPANPGGRASGALTPNQPAAAAAAQPAATAADTAIAKPDFASLVASPSAQTQDAPTQAGSQPGETSRPGSPPPALQSAPAATIQVYNRIIERADGRAQRFEIRLDPAELGRVDVRIEIGADRKVHAVLAAHDSAALSDLMRGQRALERALADAGIDLADNGVRFELARDNGGGTAGQQRNSDGRPAQADVWRRFDTMTMPATSEAVTAVQPNWRPQRLDLVA